MPSKGKNCFPALFQFKYTDVKHFKHPNPAFKLTRCKLGVFHLPVVGAAALVEARVHRGAAVAQSARAAAHGGVRGVKVLRTLEAIVVVPVGVEPAVAVLALRVRDAQVPGEVSEQQAAQQTHHPGQPQRSTPDGVTRSACVTHWSLVMWDRSDSHIRGLR